MANDHGVELPLLPFHHYVGALGPFVAAFIVTAIGGWRSGLSDLGSRLIRWRVGLKWYAVALIGPGSIFVLASTILAGFGQSWPDFSGFGVSEEFPRLGFVSTFVLYTLTFGIGEETGWRGYALPRFQRHCNAFVATLLVTACWGIWHLPLYLYRPWGHDHTLGSAP
ncbi:CPBP family intramembrane glutamic endopeptidase [Petrachloros mirabilis]